MKATLAEAIDMVVENALQSIESVVKVEGTTEPTAVGGCWETDENGNGIMGIYLYVSGKQIFHMQDIGTRVYV